MRLEIKEGVNSCLLINDYYNSDINSLQIATGVPEQSRPTPIFGQNGNSLRHTTGWDLRRTIVLRGRSIVATEQDQSSDCIGCEDS